jgi:hypothetical protein
VDADMLERLRGELAALDLPPEVVERELMRTVEAFAQPQSDADRMVVQLQRKDVYT